MEYALTRLVAGGPPQLTIDKEEYQRLFAAKAGLQRALGLEEKWNILVDNFRAFESHMLASALDETLRDTREWSDRMNVLHEANRHVINLLSAARLYLDQTKHDLSEAFGSAELQAFSGQASVQYDARLGYRVMEELRNYVQHRGLPIQSVSFGAQRRVIMGREYTAHYFHPRIDVDALASDPKVKARVIGELRDHGDRISLKEFGREYIAGLSSAHAVLRSILQPRIDEWAATFAQAHERYLSESGTQNTTGLAAVEFDLDGNVVAEEFVSTELPRRLTWLVKRNPVPLRPDANIVSGE